MVGPYTSSLRISTSHILSCAPSSSSGESALEGNRVWGSPLLGGWRGDFWRFGVWGFWDLLVEGLGFAALRVLALGVGGWCYC